MRTVSIVVLALVAVIVGPALVAAAPCDTLTDLDLVNTTVTHAELVPAGTFRLAEG